ncbi:MAG: metallophosphoesterase [Fermentimonas sp.]|jgi:predicted MPP superfamily phosphohydrolase
MKKEYLLNCIFVLFLSFQFVSCESSEENVKFGLITDVHYARCENIGNRNYDQSDDKVRIAMDEFKLHSLDFIIQLGDFKDQGKTREETITFLKEINGVLDSYGKPIYHVLGNHDMDNISKKDFLSNITSPSECRGKNYYSFKVRGIKFIVLDANYRLDETDYDSGNYNWEEAMIPKHEMDWLSKELKDGDEPVVVFIHQLLDTDSNIYKGLYVHNAAEVNHLMIQSKRVLAVFQGHHHEGAYSIQDNIHYFTMKGMVEGKLPNSNSYAIVEIMPNGDILIDGYALCPDKILRNLSK